MTKFLFVTDLDSTLVGDDKALEELNYKLRRHRQEHGTKIVYITGRSLVRYQQLTTEKHLLEPDALVTAVGTEIYQDLTKKVPDAEWSAKLSQRWNRELVVTVASHFADLIPQSDTEQRPFKVSYLLAKEAALQVLPRLEELLQQRDLNIRLIYSGGKALDILPKGSNKGLAMQFLQQRWGIDAAKTIACGDSGNDISLFSMGKERGIIVGNAQPELLQWYEINPAEYRYLAKAYYAAGILEGLNYFGFLL